MKNVVLFFMSLIIFGCNSDDSAQEFSLGTSIQLTVIDTEGNDLLNPENENALAHSNIRIYYFVDGKYEEVYDPNLDHPRNFKIFKQDSHYRIGISLNYSEKEKYPKTLVKWNESKTDTLECEIYRTNSLIQAEKVWLNSKLIWDASGNSEPYYVIEQ